MLALSGNDAAQRRENRSVAPKLDTPHPKLIVKNGGRTPEGESNGLVHSG